MEFSYRASSILFVIVVAQLFDVNSSEYISAVGDPGMKNPNVRVAFEAWNFCNEAGFEAPVMGSPRMADCADLINDHNTCSLQDGKTCQVHHKVNETDNRLSTGQPFPTPGFTPYSDPDLYAAQKELYLGSLCEVHDNSSNPWNFWMVMLKNGNFDKTSTFCPQNGKKVTKIVTDRQFPCFDSGCMNPPLVYHNYSRLESIGKNQTMSLTGGFYGTYDLDADVKNGSAGNSSYFSVSWHKNVSSGSWVFSHKLTTSPKYPWLMLYLRADAATGVNGGYRHNGRGIMRKLPESPDFKLRVSLDIKKGGGGNSQFYLLEIGSCWKNNGAPCDGDAATDVTRYSEMILNPETINRCSPSNVTNCPPYHVSATGERIYRHDTARFPYSAYHLYCSPGNAANIEAPYDICDPYSNPQAQELVQLLPHPEWGVHGFPEKKGDGWVGDARTWELDVGALSSRLYFYQEPGTKPAKRVWTSMNIGTEIYVSDVGETAEWTVSDFDVLIPSDAKEPTCCTLLLFIFALTLIMLHFN